MGISVEDAVKELQARETVFVAYSQATKLPYVTCGEETYNDQVWFFAEEETLKEYEEILDLQERKETLTHLMKYQEHMKNTKRQGLPGGIIAAIPL